LSKYNWVLVVAIATNIMMNNGIADNLVKRPIKTKKPHAISKAPTNGLKKSGFGKPIFTNRPVPNF
jgi:hypothetical protein